MEIALAVEGVEDAVVDCVAGTVVALLFVLIGIDRNDRRAWRTYHVVGYDVDHEVHASLVQS